MSYADYTTNEYFVGKLDNSIKCGMNGRQLRRHMNRKYKKTMGCNGKYFRRLANSFSAS